MLSSIKTAIITIIISFISGVLLDRYKNFAPRILCSMEKPVQLKINNKKVWAFTFIMRNISNKTIHNLSLNIQGHYDDLMMDEARITKGLKFETSSENNNYNVGIPFLSKNDEFSTKIFVESREGVVKKPIVTLRSPENFKQVDGFCKNGYFATIAGIPKDISESITKRKHKRQKTSKDGREINISDKHFFDYKKILIAMMWILVIIYAGISANKYYNNIADEVTGVDNKVDTQQAGASLKQSESADKSSSTEKKESQVSSKSVGNVGNVKSTNNTNNNSSKSKVSNKASSKAEEDLNKDDIKKADLSDDDKDIKESSDSVSKDNSASSVDKEKSQVSSKDSKEDSNTTSSTETSKIDENNPNNIKNEQKEADEKVVQEKTTEQEKSKIQNNDINNSLNEKQQNSNAPISDNK